MESATGWLKEGRVCVPLDDAGDKVTSEVVADRVLPLAAGGRPVRDGRRHRTAGVLDDLAPR